MVHALSKDFKQVEPFWPFSQRAKHAEVLSNFGFEGELANVPVERLSGGQKACLKPLGFIFGAVD